MFYDTRSNNFASNCTCLLQRRFVYFYDVTLMYCKVKPFLAGNFAPIMWSNVCIKLFA